MIFLLPALSEIKALDAAETGKFTLHTHRMVVPRQDNNNLDRYTHAHR